MNAATTITLCFGLCILAACSKHPNIPSKMDPRGHNFHDLQPVISVDDVGATIAQYQELLEGIS